MLFSSTTPATEVNKPTRMATKRTEWTRTSTRSTTRRPEQSSTTTCTRSWSRRFRRGAGLQPFSIAVTLDRRSTFLTFTRRKESSKSPSASPSLASSVLPLTPRPSRQTFSSSLLSFTDRFFPPHQHARRRRIRSDGRCHFLPSRRPRWRLQVPFRRRKASHERR
jgi:hypothetical protein